MYIEIKRLSPDKLTQEVWRFYASADVNRLKVQLDRYVMQRRQSTRHRRWITLDLWDKFDSRNALTHTHPPAVPKDIRADVLHAITDNTELLF